MKRAEPRHPERNGVPARPDLDGASTMPLQATRLARKAEPFLWHEAGTKTIGLSQLTSGLLSVMITDSIQHFFFLTRKLKKVTLAFRALLLCDYMFYPNDRLIQKCSAEI